MNIFYWIGDPKQCAEWHIDKHVSKMLIEYAQLMSTAHRVLDGEQYTDLSKTGRKVKRWKLSNPNADNTIYLACHVNPLVLFGCVSLFLITTGCTTFGKNCMKNSSLDTGTRTVLLRCYVNF